MSFLLTAFVVAYIIQAYFWVWGYHRPPNCIEEEGSTPAPLPSVSVVIGAKNESENLSNHLPSILTQDYPHYEVIVVDDHSTDDTSAILQSYAKEYKQLKVLANEDHGKKSALTLGITESISPWILCTDADCKPNGCDWINTMMHQHNNADIILGYGPYNRAATFLNAFIAYETWYIAMQYMSAALRNCAYMGVGRNLCFRKSIWEEVGGYRAHESITSGDDDLFVNEVADKRVLIETNPKSWTYSIPPSTLREVWQQKRRHLTTANAYSGKNQFLLSLNFISTFLVFFLSVILLIKGCYCIIIPLFIRWIYQSIISKRWMSRLGTMDLWPLISFWDLFLTLYYSVHGLFLWKRKKDW